MKKFITTLGICSFLSLFSANTFAQTSGETFTCNGSNYAKTSSTDTGADAESSADDVLTESLYSVASDGSTALVFTLITNDAGDWTGIDASGTVIYQDQYDPLIGDWAVVIGGQTFRSWEEFDAYLTAICFYGDFSSGGIISIGGVEIYSLSLSSSSTSGSGKVCGLLNALQKGKGSVTSTAKRAKNYIVDGRSLRCQK